MLDGNLTAETASVNTQTDHSPIDAVKLWIKTMGKKGMYQPTSAQLRVAALTQLTSILGDDDPQEPAWLLANIEELGQRWARANMGNGDTMRTYVSRAKGALDDYLKYQANPGNFKGRSGPAKPAREKKPAAEKEKPESVELVTADAAPPPPPTAQPISTPAAPHAAASQNSGSQEIRFALNDIGRVYSYRLPDGPAVTVKEVAKIFCHLLSYARDFDPTNPTQAEFYFKAVSTANAPAEDGQSR